MTDDRPTTELPALGRAQLPTAWSDSETRMAANRQLRVAVLLLMLAAAATAGTVVVPALGLLDEPWGLPVMVAVAGLAGGALAGAITLFVLWVRRRSFLRSGPWEAGQLTLQQGRYATLAHGRRVAEVRLDVTTAGLGDPGEQVSVQVRSDGDVHLITLPPSRRIIRGTTCDHASKAPDTA